MSAFARDFPRGPLAAMAALVGASLLAVLLARVTGFEPVRMTPAPVVEAQDLRFADRPGGAIDVFAQSRRVAVLESGSAGFVRVVMRSLVRDRRMHGFGPEEAFRVRRHADGRLSIMDLATGRVVDLAGFGPDNVAAFSRLIAEKEPPA